MYSLDSSNTPLEGGVGTVQDPPQGGCWTVGTPPPIGGCSKNHAPHDLFNYITLHPLKILLHPPIFEILENTLALCDQ